MFLDIARTNIQIIIHTMGNLAIWMLVGVDVSKKRTVYRETHFAHRLKKTSADTPTARSLFTDIAPNS